MRVQPEFHFDFASPNAYLSHRVVPSIEQRTGVRFTYVPTLLGGIFKATNNVSPVVTSQGVKNKNEYTRREIERFLAKHAITDFQFNPHFPVNTLALMRGAVAAQRLGCFERYVDEVFRHMWVEPKKLDDLEVFRSALESSGLPAAELLTLCQDASVKQELADNTARSVARGTFGTPSFFVGDELFFGKDRLREVEEEIELQRSRA
jgi:2-hydroxychromene-2-carboxylate isomerase